MPYLVFMISSAENTGVHGRYEGVLSENIAQDTLRSTIAETKIGKRARDVYAVAALQSYRSRLKNIKH